MPFHSKFIYSYTIHIGQGFSTKISLYFSLRIGILATQHQTERDRKLKKRAFFNLPMPLLKYQSKMLLMKYYVVFFPTKSEK